MHNIAVASGSTLISISRNHLSGGSMPRCANILGLSVMKATKNVVGCGEVGGRMTAQVAKEGRSDIFLGHLVAICFVSHVCLLNTYKQVISVSSRY